MFEAMIYTFIALAGIFGLFVTDGIAFTFSGLCIIMGCCFGVPAWHDYIKSRKNNR